QLQYPHITQIENERVLSIIKQERYFLVTTTENIYESEVVVVAINSSNPFTISGCLTPYVVPHKKSLPTKNRLQLENNDHLVFENMYAAGTLAGHRSKLAIAAGSGAAVSTDILTLWNNSIETPALYCLSKK